MKLGVLDYICGPTPHAKLGIWHFKQSNFTFYNESLLMIKITSCAVHKCNGRTQTMSPEYSLVVHVLINSMCLIAIASGTRTRNTSLQSSSSSSSITKPALINELVKGKLFSPAVRHLGFVYALESTSMSIWQYLSLSEIWLNWLLNFYTVQVLMPC